MKILNVGRRIGWVVLAAMLIAALPVRADDYTDNLTKAEALLHQAWNPEGDALPLDQQAALLKQAIDLVAKLPVRAVHGHRSHALDLMRKALDEINKDDQEHKAFGLMKDADGEMRELMEETR